MTCAYLWYFLTNQRVVYTYLFWIFFLFFVIFWIFSHLQKKVATFQNSSFVLYYYPFFFKRSISFYTYTFKIMLIFSWKQFHENFAEIDFTKKKPRIFFLIFQRRFPLRPRKQNRKGSTQRCLRCNSRRYKEKWPMAWSSYFYKFWWRS